MEGIMALLIPVLGMIFAVGFPLSIPIVVLVLRYRRRKHTIELLHAERMAAIERGMEIPPLPLDIEPARPPQSGLLRGLICTGLGIALVGSWMFIERDGIAVAGLILAGIGLAYLAYYGLEGRKLVPQAPAAARPEELR